jgi:hypothetical protein
MAPEQRFSWTQPLCTRCWPEFINEPGREPIGILAPPTGRCCHCGESTAAGIYVRVDPTGDFCAYPTQTKDS